MNNHRMNQMDIEWNGINLICVEWINDNRVNLIYIEWINDDKRNEIHI